MTDSKTVPDASSFVVRHRSELSIVPMWARVLAAVLFAGSLLAVGVLVVRGDMPVFMLAMALFLGSLLAGVALLAGYVNQDARRRGMNSTLWTILVLVIPNGIGFVVYFVARQPLQVPCPRCGARVPSEVSYCARCGFKVAPTCPRCGRSLAANQAYCAHCGEAVADKGIGVGVEGSTPSARIAPEP
jgi:ribosomal protein L37E